MQPSHAWIRSYAWARLGRRSESIGCLGWRAYSTGGTGELVEAQGAYNEPEVIDPADILSDVSESTKLPKYSGETRPAFISRFDESNAPARTIKTMLFADVQAFSQVIEERTGEFVQVFHGGIAEMMDRLSCKPAFVNTWGDSFFAVFDELEDALKLALEARDYFNKGDWTDLLGGGSMEARISMHAGPVYEEFDPILKEEIFGRHVNQATQLSP